jgi:hypothetical protein
MSARDFSMWITGSVYPICQSIGQPKADSFQPGTIQHLHYRCIRVDPFMAPIVRPLNLVLSS